MEQTYKIPSRFYSLDLIRGSLTFFIILFHWQHFFYDGTVVSPQFDRESQPFYAILTPLYTQGFYSVDFFFSLSGFIFFWLYGESIKDRTVSAYKYTVLRFSRLYPLQLVSLLIVALLQYVSMARTGQYTIYPENDAYHFLLNLLFINAWGFEKGFSFDAPAWTVSVEVLMYICFFFLAYAGLARSLVVTIVIAILGMLIEKHVNIKIGMGFHSFYMGGLAYLLYIKLRRYDLKKVLAIMSPIFVLLWLVAVVNMYAISFPQLNALGLSMFAARGITGEFGTSSPWVTVLLLPYTILFLAVLETVRGTFGKRVHVLGDMSYALYLLHVPMQMVFILVAPMLGIEQSFFYTFTSMVLYYVVLFPTAYFCYYYFELPAQDFLRKRLKREKRGTRELPPARAS